MRATVLALLALALVAPAILAHGNGLHLSEVKLSYSPLEAGQRLTFQVRNDGSEDALGARVHVTLRDAIMHQSYAIPSIRYGESIEADVLLPARLAPHACIVVTAGTRASEEVCALATGMPSL